MNYISIADIEIRTTVKRLQEFTGAVQDDEAGVYEATLTAILTRAEGRVENYLGAHYQIPVPVSGAVQEWVLAIAENELYSRGTGGSVPEKITKAYEEALEDLRAIAKGEMSLAGAIAPEASETSGAGVEVGSDDAYMSQTELCFY